MCRIKCFEVEIGEDVGPSSTEEKLLREVNGTGDSKGRRNWLYTVNVHVILRRVKMYSALEHILRSR